MRMRTKSSRMAVWFTTLCMQPVVRNLRIRCLFPVRSNTAAMRSLVSGRVGRSGIADEASPKSSQRASMSRWRPSAPQHQCGAYGAPLTGAIS
jgi:hypothetical protein